MESTTVATPLVRARRTLTTFGASAPLTLALLAVILVAALAAGTFHGRITPGQPQRFGMGLDVVEDGRPWTTVSSALFVDHPGALLSSLLLVGGVVGAYEARFGAGWTLAVWLVGNLGSTLLGALVWHIAATRLGAAPVATVAVREVGTSAGYWCALAGRLGWPPAWSRGERALGLAAAALLVGVFLAGRTFTDVEHLSAYAIGLLAFGLAQRRFAAGRRARAFSAHQLRQAHGALTGLVAAVAGLGAGGGWALLAAGAGLVLIVASLCAPPSRGPALVAGGLAVAALTATIQPEPVLLANAALWIVASPWAVAQWKGRRRSEGSS